MKLIKTLLIFLFIVLFTLAIRYFSSIAFQKEIPQVTPTPTVLSKKESNILLASNIASEKGLTDTEWDCWYDLIDRESKWNHEAVNPTSGAFGLAQALPKEKMSTHGDITDPSVQILWMLDYVAKRYGTFCYALRFQINNNYY